MLRTACLAAAALAIAAPAGAQDATLWTPLIKRPVATVGMDRAPPTPQADGSLETWVMIAFSAPQASEEGVWHYMIGRYRTDCADRRTAVMEARLVSAEGQVIAREGRDEPEWSPVEPGTPNVELVEVLCDGRPLPDGPVWDTATFVAQTLDPDAPTPAWPPVALPPPVPVAPVR